MSEQELELQNSNVENIDERERSEEDRTEEEVAAYVGSKANVYLIKWNHGSMWNWSAFFMGVYWMLYRKMYMFTTFVLFGFSIVTTGIYQVMSMLEFPMEDYPLTFMIVVYAIFKLSVGVIGDSLYQVHVSRKLAKLSHETDNISKQELTRKGGTHTVFPSIVLSLQLVCYIVVLIDEDMLKFKAQSNSLETTEASEFAIRKGSMAEMATAITGSNWEDKVGYQRLVEFSRWILEEWRGQGADIELLGNDRTAEAELWAQMALEYFDEPGNRDNTLVDAMRWIADIWPTLMSSRSNERHPESAEDTGKVAQHENKQTSTLESKLIEAVIYDEEAHVKQLLAEGANPDARDEYGQTALMLSGYYNHPGIMKLLLAANADATLSKDDEGGNALLYAVSDSLNINGEINKSEADVVAMVKLLLQSGSDPNSRYTSGLLEGQTALMEAARSYPQAAELLLQAGAEPNVKDQNGNIPSE
ncbi:ankyrin repeat domain-containing protein [Cohnella mopanensis]|uniref:ankyrin repeat domain-containing protein n=1 Tax=Cohnella mopanensis TaxID=2911966 RepID=UPI001EF87DF2|nr:ankyrin repeat domain-containing protein [Cohnella mopanensis]